MIECIPGMTLPIFAIALIGFLYSRSVTPNLSGANKISVEPLLRLIRAAVLLQLFPLGNAQRGAFVSFAALPPALFNYLLTDRFRHNPERVASIVMAGHRAGIVFLPVVLLLAL